MPRWCESHGRATSQATRFEVCQVNEKVLEAKLVHVDMVEDADLSPSPETLRGMSRRSGASLFYLGNPFIPFRVTDDHNEDVFPVYTPKTPVDLEVVSVSPVFRGNAGIVHARCAEQDLYFFSPEKAESDRNRAGKPERFLMCAVGIGHAPASCEEPFKGIFYLEELRIKRVMRRIGRYLALETEAWFGGGTPLEVLTNFQHFQDRKGHALRHVFYLLGKRSSA